MDVWGFLSSAVAPWWAVPASTLVGVLLTWWLTQAAQERAYARDLAARNFDMRFRSYREFAAAVVVAGEKTPRGGVTPSEYMARILDAFMAVEVLGPAKLVEVAREAAQAPGSESKNLNNLVSEFRSLAADDLRRRIPR